MGFLETWDTLMVMSSTTWTLFLLQARDIVLLETLALCLTRYSDPTIHQGQCLLPLDTDEEEGMLPLVLLSVSHISTEVLNRGHLLERELWT